jgi:hypothetical protein
VANGTGTPVYIAKDLTLTASYRLVLRHQPGPVSSSVLWINPADESDARQRVEATDNSRAANIHAIALRESLSAGDGMGSLFLDELRVGTQFSDVAGVNTPPSITPIPDQSAGADQVVGPLAFHVSDRETPSDRLSLDFSSSNPDLVPPTAVSFSGLGADRTFSLLPAAGRQGVALITLEVSDGERRSSTSFTLIVGAPAVTGPPRVDVPAGGSVAGLEFTVWDRETLPELLTLQVQSSDPTLLPAAGLRWTGQGITRRLGITPSPSLTGVAVLTAIVSDGQLTATNRTVVTVYPRLGTLLGESFDYPDGSVVTGGSPWLIHAPDPGDPANIVVRDGALQLSATRAEDVHAALPGAPFAPGSGALLFAGFRLRCTTLPSGGGGFFAHYRDDHTTYRGRVHIASSDTTPGRFRLGIASASGTPAYASPHLAPGEWIAVVTRYNVATGESALWLNATSEQDAATFASDDPSPATVGNWSFRQADGIGGLEVDDLRIAGSWAAAAGTVMPPRLDLARSGSKLVLSWVSTPGVGLQEAIALGTGSWADVEATPVESAGRSSVEFVPGQRAAFFRLVRR